MPSGERKLSELEHTIGYAFRNQELLQTSLRHKSALEGKDGACNDKLEWLGDRVVGLFIADYLFHHYEKPRSWLSSTKSKWASEECLAQVALKINLPRYMELGRGEEKSGGSKKASILAGTLEALVGAVFLDSNSYSMTRRVLLDVFSRGGGLEGLLLSVNYKGLLQRWCLKQFECLPEYVILDNNHGGLPPHYWVAVKIHGKTISIGEGKSKKKAEQSAAGDAWEKLVSERIDDDKTRCD